jgi:hypothetical protein
MIPVLRSDAGATPSAAKSGSIPALSRNGKAWMVSPARISPVAYLRVTQPVLG